MIHTALMLLTIYLFYILYNLISYHYVLTENIYLADDDKVFEKLKDSVFAKIIFKADAIVSQIRKVYLPAVALSIIGVLSVWIPFALGYPPALVLYAIVSIVVAFTISQHILFNYYPDWILKWYNVLVSTHLQIHLEFVQNELKECHTKLVAVKNGELVLSDEELVSLQTYTLGISQEALQVSTIIKETQSQ
jgi:hypothetical protein